MGGVVDVEGVHVGGDSPIVEDVGEGGGGLEAELGDEALCLIRRGRMHSGSYFSFLFLFRF